RLTMLSASEQRLASLSGWNSGTARRSSGPAVPSAPESGSRSAAVAPEGRAETAESFLPVTADIIVGSSGSIAIDSPSRSGRNSPGGVQGLTGPLRRDLIMVL